MQSLTIRLAGLLLAIVAAAIAIVYLYAVPVFVFLGLTAWDNQKLKVMATATGPQQESFAVIGALMLYLDFINLFLFMLRLFGGRRR